MALKLEAGKYYRDADGNKVGPIRLCIEYTDGTKTFDLSDETHDLWYENGHSVRRRPASLIEEWQDEQPVTPQNLDEVMQSIYDYAKSKGLHVCNVYCETDSGVEISKSWRKE